MVVHRELQADVKQRELGRRVFIEHQVQMIEPVHQSRAPMGHPVCIVMPHLHVIPAFGRSNEVRLYLQAPAPRRNAITGVNATKIKDTPHRLLHIVFQLGKKRASGVFLNRLRLVIRREQRVLQPDKRPE